MQNTAGGTKATGFESSGAELQQQVSVVLSIGYYFIQNEETLSVEAKGRLLNNERQKQGTEKMKISTRRRHIWSYKMVQNLGKRRSHFITTISNPIRFFQTQIDLVNKIILGLLFLLLSCFFIVKQCKLSL